MDQFNRSAEDGGSLVAKINCHESRTGFVNFEVRLSNHHIQIDTFRVLIITNIYFRTSGPLMKPFLHTYRND